MKASLFSRISTMFGAAIAVAVFLLPVTAQAQGVTAGVYRDSDDKNDYIIIDADGNLFAAEKKGKAYKKVDGAEPTFKIGANGEVTGPYVQMMLSQMQAMAQQAGLSLSLTAQCSASEVNLVIKMGDNAIPVKKYKRDAKAQMI